MYERIECVCVVCSISSASGIFFFQWLMALSSQNTLKSQYTHVLIQMQMQPKGTKEHRSYVKIRDNYSNYVNFLLFSALETVLDHFLLLVLLIFFFSSLGCGQFSSSASAMHTITRSRVQFVKRPQVFVFCVHTLQTFSVLVWFGLCPQFYWN